MKSNNKNHLKNKSEKQHKPFKNIKNRHQLDFNFKIEY